MSLPHIVPTSGMSGKYSHSPEFPERDTLVAGPEMNWLSMLAFIPVWRLSRGNSVKKPPPGQRPVTASKITSRRWPSSEPRIRLSPKARYFHLTYADGGNCPVTLTS